MKTVEQELERARRKLQQKNAKTASLLDGFLEELEQASQELGTEPGPCGGAPALVFGGPGVSVWRQSEQIVGKKFVRQLQSHHRDYFGYLSSLGKKLEKVLDLSAVALQGESLLERGALVRLLGAASQSEAGPWAMQEEPLCGRSGREAAQEVQRAVEARDAERAFEAFAGAEAALEHFDGELKLALCKLAFLSLARSGRGEAAQAVLRKAASYCGPGGLGQLGELLHASLYAEPELPGRLSHAGSEALLVQAAKGLARSARRARGAKEAPELPEIAAAGILALPELLRCAKAADCFPGAREQEVPVCVELPARMAHHSLVSCPISREVCGGEANRALLQKCGHVVSENSVRKTLDANRSLKDLGVFKCPTCPNEQPLASMAPLAF